MRDRWTIWSGEEEDRRGGGGKTDGQRGVMNEGGLMIAGGQVDAEVERRTEDRGTEREREKRQWTCREYRTKGGRGKEVNN